MTLKNILSEITSFVSVLGYMAAVFAAVTLGVFLLFSPVFIGLYFMEQKSCIAQTESFESRFEFWKGCQLKINDKWVQWDNYRAVMDDQQGD